MLPARLDPFTLAYGPYVPARFTDIRSALGAEGIDPFDRDAWSIARPVAELLRELRPDEGLGEAVADLLALTHAAFLFWQEGERRINLSRPSLDQLVQAPAVPPGGPGGRTAYYAGLPPGRVWGTPVPAAQPEPLEGWFATAAGDRLEVVAVFGLLPGRPGFTVARAEGRPPGALARADQSPLFSPVLPGGAAAGLWSVVGGEELLELGWRVHGRILAAGGPAPGPAEGGD